MPGVPAAARSTKRVHDVSVAHHGSAVYSDFIYAMIITDCFLTTKKLA
jgi:hypothetical protein